MYVCVRKLYVLRNTIILQQWNGNGIWAFRSLRMLALGGKCEPGVRDIRQFDPSDKRTTARFPFIGTPDIRSRKTPEDQQGDEFMVVSYDCREREEKEKKMRTMVKGWPESERSFNQESQTHRLSDLSIMTIIRVTKCIIILFFSYLIRWRKILPIF